MRFLTRGPGRGVAGGRSFHDAAASPSPRHLMAPQGPSSPDAFTAPQIALRHYESL
jgi:hypothetical protein